MGLEQIKAESIHSESGDLMVVNAARVSFGKWKSKLDEGDKKLIRYLAKHKHISPFFHVRFTFKVEFQKSLLPPMERLMNAEWYSLPSGEVILRHSFYGWLNLLEYLSKEQATAIGARLLNKMPVSFSGFINPEKFRDRDMMKEPNVRKLVPPSHRDRFEDTTLRVTIPIFTARQFFTHRRIATNEISRRYVSDAPEFYEPNPWHKRPPSSIKQGSGKEHQDSQEVRNSYVEHLDSCSDFYAQLIGSEIAPEEARMVLPQSMMTQVIATASGDAWKRMIELRKEEHAQREIRHLAQEIEKRIKEKR